MKIYKHGTFWCIINLGNKHTKEGAMNEKLELRKLLIYAISVYRIPQKIKGMTDKRKRKGIPFFNLIMPVFMALLLQYESFHTFFSAPESMGRRFGNFIRGRIPKVDAVRDALALLEADEVGDLLDSIVEKTYRNAVFRSGTIGGYTAAAVDGVELFSSTKKSCRKCLTRKNKAGQTEYFHRSVVCASIGHSPHVALGQEMLTPRDGGEKDEGELTGGKRLVRDLHRKFGHFADVIVADALYLNAPFLNTVLDCHMDAVIRLKDEERLIYKDAKGLFEKGEGRKDGFRRGRKRIEAWDTSGFEMEGVTVPLRVVRFCEHEEKKDGTEEVHWVWLVTTSDVVPYEILWKMMHKRWDIEENVFHQLKTYYYAKHCYCHAGVEAVFLLTLVAFNIRELYLYRRIHWFKGSRVTRKSVTRIFRDDLLVENYCSLLYQEGG